MKLGRRVVLGPLLFVLGGCSSIGSITGAITGAAAGGGSVNPAVGYAVGIGSKAATDALIKYLTRRRHEGEQDELARVAGDLSPGATIMWAIHHKIPLFDDSHGRMTVVREIPNALAPCKELVFDVLAGPAGRLQGRYTTAVCRQANGWRWAQAEPATGRWGFLQ